MAFGMKHSRYNPHVHCEQCNGTGRAPLKPALLRTWRELRELKGALSWGLKEKGITVNAINNRLIELEKLGLVRRVGKHGKWIEWRAVK